MTEIASRALSLGINDTGTALEVISSGTRLLKKRTDLIRKASASKKATQYSRVFVPSLQADALIATLFAPIARDGVAMFEVGIRIQKTLRSLKKYDPEYQAGCEFYASFTKEHFNMTLKTQYEKDLVSNAWRVDTGK